MGSKNRFALCIFILSLITVPFFSCTVSTNSSSLPVRLTIESREIITDLAEVSLVISSSDMDTIEETYNAPLESIEIEVPAGEDREFELSVYVAGETGFAAYQGSAVEDLTAGETKDIAITLDFTGGKIYVANWLSDSVSVIDGARNTILDTITVGDEPGGVGVNTTTNRVYVANANDGTLSIIDAAADTVTNTLSITASTTNPDPHFVDVNSTTNRIYVSEFYDGSNITVVNGGTESVVTTIDNTGSYSYGLGVNPVTNKIYSAKWNPVAVLNGASNTYIGDVAGGSWSECADVAVNPDLNKIYVVDLGNDSVHVVDGSTDTEMVTIAVGLTPYGIDIDVDRNMIYVSNFTDGTVSVINGATDSVVDTVTVGTDPMGVAVNPATGRVYVANSGSDNVSVIDGLTNIVIATVPVQLSPYLIAVLP